MKTRGLVLVGGGGHCRSVIDIILAEGMLSIAGILDNKLEVGSEIFGYRVLGGDELLVKLVENKHEFLICVGQIKDANPRVQLYRKITDLGGKLVKTVSPKAYISQFAKLSQGCVVGHGATVNAGASVGENCIINSHALIEHDSCIGKHSHISTGAIINGSVNIGQCCFIGSGAIIKNGVSIGSNVVIGAGAKVSQDVPSNSVLRHSN